MVTISIYCNNAAGGATGTAKRIDFDNRSFTGPEIVTWPRQAGKVKGVPREGVQIGSRRIFPAVKYQRGTGRTDTVTVEDAVHGEIMDALRDAGWQEVKFIDGGEA